MYTYIYIYTCLHKLRIYIYTDKTILEAMHSHLHLLIHEHTTWLLVLVCYSRGLLDTIWYVCVCVCVYIYIYIFLLCQHEHGRHSVYQCVYVYVYINMGVTLCLHIYIYTYIHMHTHVWTWPSIFVCAYIYIYIYIYNQCTYELVAGVSMLLTRSFTHNLVRLFLSFPCIHVYSQS